jgi:hypothetical protein
MPVRFHNRINGGDISTAEDTAREVRRWISRYGRSSQVRSNITRSPRI